nr:ADM_HP1_G0005890.mRNA.1.CDS.1 [Saccharomyces cerevisiae]
MIIEPVVVIEVANVITHGVSKRNFSLMIVISTATMTFTNKDHKTITSKLNEGKLSKREIETSMPS